MKKILLIAALALASIQVQAHEQGRPGDVEHIFASIDECKNYQIMILATRGGKTLSTEILDYCGLKQAQVRLDQLNALAPQPAKGGRPIEITAIPLF